MKHAAIALSLCCLMAVTPAPVRAFQDTGATLHDVIDGYTIVVHMRNKGLETIRLFGICGPAPETDINKTAKTFLRENMTGKRLGIAEYAHDGRSFPRALPVSHRLKPPRSLFSPKDTDPGPAFLDYQEELLKRGLARLDHTTDPEPFAWLYFEDWLAIESKAREAGRGLWSVEGGIPCANWREDDE